MLTPAMGEGAAGVEDLVEGTDRKRSADSADERGSDEIICFSIRVAPRNPR
jgi:hypothetical protein